MKLRINNNEAKAIKVVLEPWASEFEVKSGDFIDFISEGKVPDSGFFQVENNMYGVIVSPEWESALVHTYNSKGEAID